MLGWLPERVSLKFSAVLGLINAPNANHVAAAFALLQHKMQMELNTLGKLHTLLYKWEKRRESERHFKISKKPTHLRGGDRKKIEHKDT